MPENKRLQNPEGQKVHLPKMQGHHCFACGTANPIGLNLDFYLSDGSVCTDITLTQYHVGWQNMAHGGIVSTLLDEVMSWTAIYLKKEYFITRRMEIKYIKPVLIDIPLTVKGQLLRDLRGPFVEVKAEILNPQAEVLAKSIGRFVSVSNDDYFLVPEESQNEIQQWVKSLPSIYK
jgi:acyl-CoA thioesterase FadM